MFSIHSGTFVLDCPSSHLSDQTDSADLTIPDDNSAQSLGDIQADSLGENNQVSFDANVEKEAIAHELEDNGPVFSHEASMPELEKETSDTNDMSHYDSEDINLVGNSRHKMVKTKPVRLPSLTEEGNVCHFHASSLKAVYTQTCKRIELISRT